MLMKMSGSLIKHKNIEKSLVKGKKEWIWIKVYKNYENYIYIFYQPYIDLYSLVNRWKEMRESTKYFASIKLLQNLWKAGNIEKRNYI